MTRLALTAAVALCLAVAVTGSVCLSAMCPLWTLLTVPALAVNGWVGADVIETIWRK